MSKRQPDLPAALSLEAVLLGVAQDAGVPHIGCDCPTCALARHDPLQRQQPSSLALIDHRAGASWLIDATPAFPEQLAMLHEYAPNCQLAGVLLTHAHMGHYTGLMYLGREALNAQALPVYASPTLCAYLTTNGPWSQLVALGNISLRPIAASEPLALSEHLRVTPLPVPHRAEFSDTVAYLVRGSTRSLFYCPDIDRWEQWSESLPRVLETVDVALLDGTFFSAADLPGRDLTEIPHPFVRKTAELLAGTPAHVHFIHLNHSNPLLRAGAERRWLVEQGMGIGVAGQRFALADADITERFGPSGEANKEMSEERR
jgi:pyrroloquinoline quinone biosynthesis protein B